MAEIARFDKRVAEHEAWTRSGPVSSHLDEEDIEQLEETAVATVADPAALGLWGFATGTWIAGVIIAGWLPASAMTANASVLLVFAGIVQFIAGLYAFRRANVLAATAFCSFGAFNVAAALFFLFQASGLVATGAGATIVMGDLLVSFAFIALALTVAALRTNMALVATLGFLTVGYALAGIPRIADAVGAGGWTIIGSIGGAFLIASAACAFYTGAAIVVNSTWKRSVFPLGGKA